MAANEYVRTIAQTQDEMAEKEKRNAKKP